MRSPRLRIPTSAPLLLAAALAAPAGCAAEPTARRAPDPALQAELRRIDTSRKHIDDAGRAVSDRRYADARALLDKASALGVDAHRYEIGELREKLDRREAKLWANEAAELLEQEDCEAAFRLLSARIAELGSEAFTREVRRLLRSDAVACASKQVDTATVAGRFAEARAFLAAAPTRAVLGAADAERLAAELDATIAEVLYGQLEADLAAGRWAAAVGSIDAAVARGDASEEQGRALVARVRAAAAPRLAELAGKAIGKEGAAAALEHIDAAIARLGWEPAVAALPGSNALPEPLARKRAALAAWVEAVRLGMKPMKRPSMRWSHGTVAVAPASDADGPPTRSLAPSTAVWVIGQTKQHALVTAEDPGTAVLTKALDAAIGWVPLARLALEPTLDWLPPDDELKGARVWGPLREGQPTLELGVVSEVRGADVIVQRLADDAAIALPRKLLRSGRLAPGTRVLALCETEDQPATIVEVLPDGRMARIQCDGGVQKQEPLASLRSRPDLLPRRGR